MKKKNIVLVLIVFVLFVTFNGCDSAAGNGNASNGNNNNNGTGNNSNNNGTGNNNNNNGNGNNNNGTGNNSGNQGFLALARMDIEDAHTVFIAPKPGTDKDELYKITDNGKVEEVTYFDETEEVMPIDSEPSAVYNVGANYVIVCYGYNEGYLVRKNDGAVFYLNDVGIPSGGSAFINLPDIQLDSNGNVYYRMRHTSTNTFSVIKLNVQNPTNLTSTVITPNTDNVYVFVVSPEGHLGYGYNGYNNRIRKSNGGLYNLPTINALYQRMWVGIDGKIKYYDANSGLYTVTIDQNFNVSETTISKTFWWTGGGYMLKFSTRTLFVQNGVDVNKYFVYEMENPENNPNIKQNIGDYFNMVSSAGKSNNYYYISGNNKSNQPILLKINPENDNVTTILTANIFEIITMNVMENDTITFNGLRMHDGRYVIGNISASGQITILDETLNSEVVVLERIR